MLYKPSRRLLAGATLAVLVLAGWQAAEARTSAPAPVAAPSAAQSVGETETYTGVAPCRLVDTRKTAGPMVGVARSFDASGDLTAQGGSANCGIPANATSIAVNLTGITTTPGGYLRGWAAGSPAPTATLLNYAPAINASNQVNIPLCQGGACPDAFTLRNHAGDVHVVADVVGYYQAPIYATISSSGVVDTARSSSIVSVVHPNAGVYEITFERAVDGCAPAVVDRDIVTNHNFAVSPVSNEPTKVTVWSKTDAGTLANTPFHVSFTC